MRINVFIKLFIRIKKTRTKKQVKSRHIGTLISKLQNGKINKVFTGEKCSIEFLNFLPDNTVVYFHNLAYDWCMFNSNVKMI